MISMESPTSRYLAEADSLLMIEDAEGRVLTLRRLNALDKLRLFKAAGPSLSQNHLWLGMATLACSVSAIDDIPVPAPTSETQIEALVSRLGDCGISAIADALVPNTPAAPSSDQAHHAGN